MPGPRAKGKSGSKPKSSAGLKHRNATESLSTAGLADQAYVNDIGNTEDWNLVVDILCAHFKLPDLTTRSGLKKIHARFPEIHRKLDNAYTANAGNERMMGGIIGIWTKMCADSILRDKLFKEGLVAKMMPLLDMPSARHVGLRTLSTVTQHGGAEARKEIARHSPTLVRLMQEFPDDPKVIELATSTMAHSIGAVTSVEEKPDQKLLKAIDIRSVLKTTVDNLRNPKASYLAMTHALGLVTSTTLHCSNECKSLPQLLTYLVACLRSNDLTTRCNALGGLIRLSHADSEPDMVFCDPYKLVANVRRGFSPELSDAMMNYGPAECDTTLIIRTMTDYQNAMMKCAQDHNLCALGRKLGPLILRTEFAIAEGGFQAVNERTGQMELMDVGLPFKMWTDALPACARTLRAKGVPADLDIADVLEMKHAILKQRVPNAIAVAKKAIARNPELAYSYYAIGLGIDDAEGLRSVKKGLKCKHITPFVRNYMLWRAVEKAANMGVTVLQEARRGEKDYAEGIAFLMSALDDAKTFLASAPPDSRNLPAILNWYILLTLTIRGPELGENLQELDLAMQKVELSDKFCNFLGYPPKKTQIRLTRQMAVSSYATAVKDWSDVIKRFDKLSEPILEDELKPTATSRPEDDLAAWLENLEVSPEEEQLPKRYSHSRISTNSVALYHCSWCGNPSAVLRKCSGCGKTRYCDSACQKAHWGDHKRTCKSA
ncbi:hypothetical protein B0H21DRAFT_491468 [Amylocystis lapponica]|nr:hypothetical protein B0H21DRAFT_491468 [Amylocystis lapponica]